MRVALPETVLLTGLLALAGFVVLDTGPALGLPDSRWLRWIAGWVPALVSLQALVLVTLLIAVYWVLQALGHRQLSFWLIAGLVVLPHAVPIWGHNQLEWYELLGAEAELIGERSLVRDAALFLASLGGVVMLQHMMGLRALDRRMVSQGISAADKGNVLRYQGLLLVGLLAAGLSLALLTVLVATLLGRYDEFIAGRVLGRGSRRRRRVGAAGAHPAALAPRPVAAPDVVGCRRTAADPLRRRCARRYPRRMGNVEGVDVLLTPQPSAQRQPMHYQHGIAKRSSEWPIVSEFSLLSDSWGDSFRKSASFEIERP